MLVPKILRRTAVSVSMLAIGMQISATAWAACSPTSINRPVCPATAVAEEASFIDPTVTIASPTQVTIDKQSFIAPFVGLNTAGIIEIGEKTDLQDNVILGGRERVTLGDEVILAHGAQVRGPAEVGRHAVAGEHNAAFIGFNSLVDGAMVEHDAMVLHLAHVNPGIVIHQGKVVLSGKNITTQAQADDPALGKVIPITDALRAFMDGVLHVNETFAREYTRMYREDPRTVRGINYDPSDGGAIPSFNPTRNLPTLAGVPTQDRRSRHRIIGDIHLADSLAAVNDDDGAFGNRISLRADEGEPFHLGHVARMKDRTTFHALEHTGLDLHDGIRFGFRSLVHGGSSAATVGNPHANTVIGDHGTLGDYAVVFRSVLGENVKVGCGSLVDSATLADGAVVPALTVIAGSSSYPVEWNPGCSTND